MNELSLSREAAYTRATLTADRPSLLRYGFAVLTTVAALVIQIAALPLLPHANYFLFTAAVMLGAIYGGRGPGLLATALATLCATLLFSEPRYSFALSREYAAMTTIFAVSAAGLSWLVGMMRNRERRATAAYERQREQTAAHVAAERERIKNIVQSVPGVVWEAWGQPDRDAQRIDFVSEGVQKMLGYSVQEWLATPNFWLTIVHPEDRERAASNAAEHFARGGTGTNEFRWVTKDGRTLSVQATSVVITDAAGKAVGMRGVTIDVTAQKRAVEALRFLSRASEILASSLDYDTTLTAAARLATSRLADLCVIDLPGTAAPDKMFIAHRDPARQKSAERLRGYDPRANPGSITDEVARTGRPMIGSVDEGLMERANLDDTMRLIVRELETRSYMIVPIEARGRIFGTMSFGSIQRDAYNAADLELADLFARRVAVAIDNAQLYQAAVAAGAAKDEFLATVSHELRTPMTATLGWTRMLLSGYLDQTMERTAIEAIERSTRAQAKLIADILDVSSITLGKFNLEVAPVDLRSVVEAAVETVRPALAAKSMSVAVDAAHWSGTANVDAARLQQVVWNLLSNAIKFGRKNGTVEVRLERIDDTARLSIRDDGIGIERDFLPFVFERFRQADGGTTRAQGGLGLGLAIVKHLVELHGGSVSATSEGRDKGALFTIELPLGVHDSAGTAAVRGSLPRLTNRTILVADQESAALDLIGAVLTRCGARVTLAGSADEAMLAMNRSRHDLLITDTAMPASGGMSLLHRVRGRDDEHASMPAIIITALDEPSVPGGAEKVLRKPVDPVALANEVARTLA